MFEKGRFKNFDLVLKCWRFYYKEIIFAFLFCRFNLHAFRVIETVKLREDKYKHFEVCVNCGKGKTTFVRAVKFFCER